MPYRKRNGRNLASSKDLFDLLEPLLLIGILAWFARDPIYKLLVASLIGFGLVYFLAKRIRYQKRMHPLHVTGVDEMSGIEFEQFVANLLRSQGYQVQNTGGLEDFGIDLIASRRELKYAVQLKRWNWPVGLSAIRAAVAGKSYYHCNKAVVITNNYFTWRAKSLARANDCKLIDRDELSKQIRMSQMKKGQV